MALAGSILLGVLAGVIAALCGVGGGIVLVPIFVKVLGMDQKIAIATSLAVIILTSLSATIQNVKSGLVDWRVCGGVALGAVVAAWFASDWMKSLSSQHLTRIFAIVLITVGVKMLFDSK